MKLKQVVKNARRVAKAFRVTDRSRFRLKDQDPGETLRVRRRGQAARQEALANGIAALSELQDMLYAQDRWAVLLVFQAMDAAGKDGAIKHVMSGVNPQGCQVYSFKAPSAEEIDHDYLWRCMKSMPERGRIGIFNRSYYEETLVTRVHPEFLAKQKIPPELLTRKVWDERFQDIRAFERYLARNGVVTCKFFLNVSKKEQKRRFLDRLENPEKNWKFSRQRRQGAASGGSAWTRTRRRSATPPRSTRRGTSSPPTASGSRGSSSPPPSSAAARLTSLSGVGGEKLKSSPRRRSLLGERLRW